MLNLRSISRDDIAAIAAGDITCLPLSWPHRLLEFEHSAKPIAFSLELIYLESSLSWKNDFSSHPTTPHLPESKTCTLTERQVCEWDELRWRDSRIVGVLARPTVRERERERCRVVPRGHPPSHVAEWVLISLLLYRFNSHQRKKTQVLSTVAQKNLRNY